MTLCDTAGMMMPDEFTAFIEDLYQQVPQLKDTFLKVLFSDTLGLAAASALAAVGAGALGIKVAFDGAGAPRLDVVAGVIAQRAIRSACSPTSR